MTLEIPKSQIYQRVLAISVDGKSSGSAYAYPVNGEHCFITAAHVLNGWKEGEQKRLKIYQGGQWRETDATPFYCDESVDTAVIKTPIPSNKDAAIVELSMENVLVGQDCYFLGFPYFGTLTPKALGLNAGFPLPFIKKAVVASINNPNIYFDGHNNPGFSGGPLVFWDHFKKIQKIMGIVSAYVTQTGEIKPIPTATGAFYTENSGIGLAYNIKPAKELIEKLYNTKLDESI